MGSVRGEGGLDRGLWLGLLQVWQAVPHLLPEQGVPPLQHDVVLQQQPQIGIELARVEAADEDEDHLLVALVHRLQQPRLEVVPRPLGLEEVLTEDDDGPLGSLACSHHRVRDHLVGRQVAVVEADSVVASSFNCVNSS